MPDEVDGGRANPDLVKLVARWRRRISWPNVVRVFLGAVSVLIASSNAFALLRNPHQPGLLSWGLIFVVFGAGCGAFAWGMAAGFRRRFLGWLALALLAGVAFVALSLLAVFLQELFSPASGGSSGNDQRRVPSGRQSTTTLAIALLDRETVEQILGMPDSAPRSIGRVFLRSRSMALWRSAAPAPLAQGAPPSTTAARRPSLTVTVLHSVKVAQQVRTSKGRQAAQALPSLGDGGVELRPPIRPGSGVRQIGVHGTRGDWAVTISVRSPEEAGDRGPEVIAAVGRCLDRLADAERK